MHYTGTVWRPPYEANSLLLEVTAGCTHHRCKFCTLYEDLPFSFRASELEVIEADLREAQMLLHSPMGRLSARLQQLPEPTPVRRVFLVGANPFALSFERLERIAQLIHNYLPSCGEIGCFARVTDVARKSDWELEQLRRLGYTGLSIGAETGDDWALSFMDKGYEARDIVEQSHRLDKVNIAYYFTYLAGISGAGRGNQGALASAEIFNQTTPQIIGSSMLTVYPSSALYGEIQAGRWQEEGELEKLEEVKTLISNLEIPVFFATLGVSNAVWVQGRLPEDRAQMAAQLERACQQESEQALREYRVNLPHL